MTAHKEGSDKISRDLAPPVARGAEKAGDAGKGYCEAVAIESRLFVSLSFLNTLLVAMLGDSLAATADSWRPKGANPPISALMPPILRKPLEGAMRCAGGFHERIVKLPHCFGEEFSGLRTGHRGTAGRPTKDGADNLSDGLGIDPALL